MSLINQLSNWYFSRKGLPYWCILILDCTIVFGSGLLVYYFQYNSLELINHYTQIFVGLISCLAVFIISFVIFHTAHGIMRYSSFVDLHRLAYSTAFACVGVCILHQIQIYCGLTPYVIFPRFINAVLIFIVSTMLMWMIRVIVKTFHDEYRTSSKTQNIFIYGCLQGGVALAKSVRAENPARYHLCGLISGDKTMDGTWLLGVQVYFDDDSVLDVLKQKNVTTIFISPLQTERFTNRTTFIDLLIRAGIKIQMMPPAEEWDGKSTLSHHQLREVEIEDLLPRQKIEVDMDGIGKMLKGKRILITGAAGSIGSELARQVAKFLPSELILIDQAETPMHDIRLWMNSFMADYSMAFSNDNLCSVPKILTIVSSITDKEHMEVIFSEHNPEYVFHAAAYKHVPMMEDNPGQAVRNNIYGTRVIADLSVKYGAKKFVMISTDKAVNPTNVMGCSKRICEIYCQALNAHLQQAHSTLNHNEKFTSTQFVTTRFGNVLGSNGSVIPIFKKQIKEGGPVKVTHPDIIRYFMLIPEACRLVLEAGTMGNGGEIFVFDMGEPVKIVDLAQRMIDLSGAKNVKIEYSGLRDGEKLFEELLATKENTKPTLHPKIMVAQVREYSYELALKNEVELYELSCNFDDMAIVKKMKDIVPEFVSRNSKYAELDRKKYLK